MKWNVIPIEAEILRDFAARYKIPEPAAQLFIRRGLTDPGDMAFFLENDLRFTHNPFLFQEMEDVVERINQAVSEGEKVLLFGDRDVDGITSLTLLASWFEEQKVDLTWKLPLEDDPYGLSMPVVEEFASQGGTLIITADCGITALKEIDRAVELGIDVIIVDHHNPPEVLPDAVGIINPKLDDSGYPFQGLSAAALSAKLLWALDFSKTDLFGQEFCLVNVRPGNDSLCFEAMVVKNLCVVRRISETLAGEASAVVFNRILPFIQGLPLMVYDWPVQKRFFDAIFGGAEVYAVDLAQDLWKRFPAIQGKSLVRVLANSKTARYSSRAPEEIEGLYQVFLLSIASRLASVDQRFKENLAYVALSLVADMMPMINENRILMRLGMETLASLPKGHHGLQAILVELDLARKPPQVRDIGWKIAPLLNSSGRMGRPDLALRLLLARDPSLCHTLIKDLTGMNIERKRLGETAWNRLMPLVKQELENNGGIYALVEDNEIPRGITGILAGKFAREFGTSAIILARVGESYVGSIRTSRGLRATWLLELCSDLLTDFGGHDAAGGFHLACSAIEAFRSRVRSVMAGWQPDAAEEPATLVDIACHAQELDDTYWELPKFFVPHGQQFDPPVFLLTGFTVGTATHLGKDSRHLNLELEGHGKKWPAIMWDGAVRYQKDFSRNDKVDILCTLERNQFRSTVSPQIVIQDIRRKADV